MADDGARRDDWDLKDHWALGVSWEDQPASPAARNAERVRLDRLARLVERTRARIETLCVLGDLVGEKTAAAVVGGSAGREVEEIEQMYARLTLQFSQSAEECEGQLLAFASETAASTDA